MLDHEALVDAGTSGVCRPAGVHLCRTVGGGLAIVSYGEDSDTPLMRLEVGDAHYKPEMLAQMERWFAELQGASTLRLMR